MYFAGVDAGSRTIKVVIIKGSDLTVSGTGIVDQGVRQAVKAKELLDKVIRNSKIKMKDIAGIVATGYGRNALSWADSKVTEITCQAYGVKQEIPNARMIIDIGGQDSKIIHLDSNGIVNDFVMNDRCAAGTGRFLEVVADRLEIKLKDIGRYSDKAASPSKISSMCVVFAEAEIVGLLAAEEAPENILAGVQNSIAKRICIMAGSGFKGPVVFTGGVALLPGMKKALQDCLEHSINVVKTPQFTGAFGAALLAAKDKY